MRFSYIARLEGALMLADPTPIIIVIAMPVILLAFLSHGLVGGPARSVPGLAVLFGFFGLASIGAAFFRDHGWNTWDRYRMSPASPWEVVAGKAAPLAVLLVVQQVVLLTLGWLVFGMPWHGSILGGALLVLSVAAVELSLGLLVVAACSTINQVMAITNLGALLLAGMAGALAPLVLLPLWVQHLAPASPVYWALRGFHYLTLRGRPASDLFAAVGVLLGVTVVASAVTLRLYRFEASKTFFA